MARPRIKIDKKQFEKLCSIQCTLEEIAGFFDCSSDTIERWCEREYKERFAEVFSKKRGIGKISLRRYQFSMAEKNPTMAIWLGKQYLGQTDKREMAISQNEDETIKKMEEYFDNQKSNTSNDMGKPD